jgi:hypothetical protein
VDIADLVPAGGRRVIRALTAVARAPAVHFLAAGAALLFARGLPSGSAPEEPRVISVPAAMVERLGAAAGQTVGESALDAWLDDEVLYREGMRRGLAWNPAAIAHLVEVGRFLGDSDDADVDVLADVKKLGLDRGDPLVRTQVGGRMRLLLFDHAMQREPTDDDLDAYLASHRNRFVRPARVTFVHVFLRRDRGARGESMAAALARRIQAGELDTENALRLGDVFQPGERFEARTRREVEAMLGAELARVAMTAPERRWSEPVASPYGWHLLRVEARTEERLPPLDAIRDRVRYAWRSDRARHEVAARIRELRERYRVEIAASPEPGAPAPRSPTTRGRTPGGVGRSLLG